MALHADGRLDAETRADKARGLVLVLGAILLYCALHTGFRLLASSVLGEDDAMEAILAQELRVAYDAVPRQPPLYNWLIFFLQRLLGTGVEVFLLIKYAALTAAAVLIYLIAYRAHGDRLFAVLSVEALALIYSIAWRYHEGFTHEVLAMVLVLAILLAVINLTDRPNGFGYVALGGLMGLGFLSEPTVYVLVAALLVAVWLQPAARSAFFRPMFVVSIALAAAMAAPYWLWVLDGERRVVTWSRLFDPGGADSLGSALDALRGPFAYLAPLIVILPLLFPGFLRTAWRDLKRRPTPAQALDVELLTLHTALVALALAVGGALLLGVRSPAVHVLMPLYLPSVVWLFGVARRSSGTPLHIQRFTRVAIAIAVLAFGARMANMYVLDPVCKTCRWGIPYAGLAQQMRAAGVSETGAILTIDKELAGNLRVHFPKAAIIARFHPTFTPNGAKVGAAGSAIVWPEEPPKKTSWRTVAPHVERALPDGVTMADAKRLVVPWRHLWRETGYRTTTWHLYVFQGSPRVRIEASAPGALPFQAEVE